MSCSSIEVSTWHSGSKLAKSKGVGTYGLKVAKKDRPCFTSYDTYMIKLPNGRIIEAEKTPGFDHKCIELRDEGFKEFLINAGLADWPLYRPHKFLLVHLEDNRWQLTSP